MGSIIRSEVHPPALIDVGRPCQAFVASRPVGTVLFHLCRFGFHTMPGNSRAPSRSIDPGNYGI
jgi:hypothetical protein